jgi:thiol-disulfide isomerase/thioredoxin
MKRYRWALLGLVALVSLGILVTAVSNRSSLSGSGPVATSGDLLPASERPAAPAFATGQGWLNSKPETLSTLRGKVVLVDFWTYSCVNCVRTIPHLRSLYDRYRARGFVIVGVHSPEFDFEKSRDNVASAVRRLGVTWPVALDPQMETWNAYNNNVWPAEYLIDQQGRLSYRNLGEGNYEATEKAVASLLSAPPPTAGPGTDRPPDGSQTPELYAGSARGKLADGEPYGPNDASTVHAERGPPSERDAIQLTGGWADHVQYVASTSPGHVRLSFHAQQVLIVASSDHGTPLTATVTVDGKPVPADQRGAALGADGVTVSRSDLFPLLVAQDPGHHLIDIAVPAGFQLYTFTFG